VQLWCLGRLSLFAFTTIVLAMQQLIAPHYIIMILVFLEFCVSFVFTNQNYDGIEVGVPFTLTWEDAEGAVALALLYKNTSSTQQQSYLIASTYNSRLWELSVDHV
jgi:hypothetical protein